MYASTAGHIKCVEILLGMGAQVNIQDKVSAVPDQLLTNPLWYEGL